ncbi:copper resistance protein B [Sulfurimonas sp. MAG313]|nr:copper resistance protein B [Sulfurimonas sp. MAG313]MDF1880612.1 copper resistance protein B [Sulfurimonas sp. MAG313]
MKNLILKSVLVLCVSSTLYAGGGGDIFRSNLTIDQLEYQLNDEKSTAWDAYGFMGFDTHKIYLYSDGEKEKGSSASSENDLVYSRAFAAYWDIQAGISYDKNSQRSNTWAQIALSGLAPYFFETRVAILADKDGNVGIRSDFAYDVLLTQKLIITPSLQMDAYTKDNVESGIGSGLSNVTIGARMRYEFRREFAPYLGVEWSKNYGKTNDISPLNQTYLALGLSMWF